MRIEQTRRREQGFSLVEMLIVVGIIAIVSAVSLPSIMQYLRHYRLRGAVDELMGEMQTARISAVRHNVNFGVLFVILSPTTYRFVIEDGQVTAADVAGGVVPGPANVSLGRALTVAEAIAIDAAAGRRIQAGLAHQLPDGMQFRADACGIAGNGNAVRFSRLGMACQPGVACNPAVAGGVAQLAFAGGQAQLCVEDRARELARCVTMTDGGRARSQLGTCP